jgi:hypothetical protein
MSPHPASWNTIAARLQAARNYWLATTSADGTPQVSPVWGAVVDGGLHVYSERSTLKARNIAVRPQVAIHLESAEDVVIVHGSMVDLGVPGDTAGVNDTFALKYHRPEDAPYLPSADPAFDVLWRLTPQRALLWRMADYDGSQQRWTAD